jgi:hypothetical protein
VRAILHLSPHCPLSPCCSVLCLKRLSSSHCVTSGSPALGFQLDVVMEDMGCQSIIYTLLPLSPLPSASPWCPHPLTWALIPGSCPHQAMTSLLQPGLPPSPVGPLNPVHNSAYRALIIFVETLLIMHLFTVRSKYLRITVSQHFY